MIHGIGNSQLLHLRRGIAIDGADLQERRGDAWHFDLRVRPGGATSEDGRLTRADRLAQCLDDDGLQRRQSSNGVWRKHLEL